MKKYEPRREKTDLRGFRPGVTQIGLYSHRSRLDACKFGYRQKKNCTFRLAKTKARLFSHMLKSGFLMTRLKYS